MSFKTWKAEFYPMAAYRVSAKNALAHSLRKWEGLKRSNLKKHGLYFNSNTRVLLDKTGYTYNTICIDESSCALCQKFSDCKGCPLNESIGKPCYLGTTSSRYSPYESFVIAGNPQPMIRALKKAIKMKEQGKILNGYSN